MFYIMFLNIFTLEKNVIKTTLIVKRTILLNNQYFLKTKSTSTTEKICIL